MANFFERNVERKGEGRLKKNKKTIAFNKYHHVPPINLRKNFFFFFIERKDTHN